MKLPQRVPQKPRAVQCTKCGAPLSIRDVHHTKSLACGSCGSILDAKDPKLAILEAGGKSRFKPTLPLGQRGELMGTKWEAIGGMVRATRVEGIEYTWREYLLFNPWKGYRWLVEANGHWTFVEPATEYPQVIRYGGSELARHEGVDFRLFQSCRGEVKAVVGEFYWEVSAGETVKMQDFVAPPFMLSKERSEDEVVWSLGAYVDADQVKAAFAIAEMPPQRGVAPAQPNPHDGFQGKPWRRTIAFFLIGTALHLYYLMTLHPGELARFPLRYEATDPVKAKVTEPFEIKGTPAWVEVESSAAINNSWIYLQMALINEETDVAYDFAREIEFYSGVEDGEAWAEGSTTDTVVIGPIPPGRYSMIVEPQTEAPAVSYGITLRRDPSSYWPFFVMAILMFLPPFLLQGLAHSFEVKRWSESDYPIGGGSDE